MGRAGGFGGQAGRAGGCCGSLIISTHETAGYMSELGHCLGFDPMRMIYWISQAIHCRGFDPRQTDGRTDGRTDTEVGAMDLWSCLERKRERPDVEMNE